MLISLNSSKTEVTLFLFYNKSVAVLFYLAAHFTISVDYRKLRTLQQNWGSKHVNVIMRNLICRLFIGYQPKQQRQKDQKMDLYKH